MGKIQPKTDRLIAITLTVLLLVACGFYLAYDSKSTLLAKQTAAVETEIAEKQLIYDNNQTKLDELNAEVDKYTNIDQTIEEIKEIYFDNALKVDALARSGEADYKVAYLTFDDGPYLMTEDFMAILERYEVQATFFIRKRNTTTFANIYPLYTKGCHTVGNHTASHDIFGSLYDSEENFINDMLEDEQHIQEMVGVTTNIMRFPGGSAQPRYMGLNRTSLINKVCAEGYGYVDWDISCGDGGADQPASVYYNNVVTKTPNYNVCVILMHDYHPSTREMLPQLIETMQSQGYIFLPLFYDSPSVKKAP